MKKTLIFLFVIILLSCSYLLQGKHSLIKVFEIVNPTSIYLDLNNNLVFDEKEPVIVHDVFFIDKNIDYSSDEVLGILTSQEKLFLDYFAKETTNKILNNKYVVYKDENIFVDKVLYSDILKKSEFFYFDEQSKRALVDYVKGLKLEEYVLLNLKSKKYHKLTCEDGAKSKKYKIIKQSLLDESDKPCKTCHVPETLLKKKAEKVEKLQEESSPQKLTPFFENPNISVFFIGLNEIDKPTSKCDNITCLALKNEIDNAKATIDFAIYGIGNQKDIFDSLVQAQRRGVKLRWVSDYDKNGSYYKDTEVLKKYLPDFNDDKSYDENNRSAIMHNKFFIFDNKKVWTGSSNLSSTDITGFNSNINVLINSSDVANIFTAEFEQMYNGKFHKDKEQKSFDSVLLDKDTKISVYFSPQDTPLRNNIIPLIRKAEKYIYIPIFFITRKELIPELKNAYDRGVDIEIIDDATNAVNQHSIHKELREYGIKVKTENKAGKIHSKALIIDDKFSVITSMNFSNSGELRNDENVVIIENKEITQYLKNNFLYLWSSIPEKYLKYDPRPESKESIGSCFDNIDNDYDGKIDAKDNGCF